MTKRFVLINVLSVMLLSLFVPVSFAGRGFVSVNARFIDFAIEDNVIHPTGTLDDPDPRFEGGTIATVGKGSPIVFGYEYRIAGGSPEQQIAGLWDIKNNPDHHVRLFIDGIVLFDNLEIWVQDPFIAQPGIGPDWTWDHDGDGLGDGNGNGVDDWDFPVMFWRFEFRPKLDFGDHIWEIALTHDGWTGWTPTYDTYSNGILRVVE